ncbi:histidine phosphatase family protein [Bacillus sp. 31A1R]|uniref:Histidine phosphatase family protein n=1 Tax=Robertmurraya mangrovi TaxID=3098077 RepID=A0ABU5J470_9BACI|nr:histidine phosphatase family protein [Bacillus sp. 31A1R]MDZ5474214.1 histidine phosphatase family protein [Bacillus sp. 31A1R]
MDDRVVITLFRHGLTEANRRKEYLGWTDSPLCFSHSPSNMDYYELYFSSDLNRCIATLKKYAPDVKPHLLTEFREMNFGVFEGKTYEQLKDCEDYQKWIAWPFKHTPPNGEAFEDFSIRIEDGWQKVINTIEKKQARKTLIMTHGGVIRYLLTTYAPNKREFWDWSVSHEMGYELIFDRDGLRRGERCTLLREVPLTANEHG